MNINDYRKAMEHINPNNELKERIIHKKPSQKRHVPFHPILAGTLTAALMLACVTYAALAASPELRTKVLSFFHIGEPENVTGRQPGTSQDEVPSQPDSSQGEDPTQPDSSQGEVPSQPDTSQGENPTQPGSSQGEDPTQPDSSQGENPTQPDSSQTEIGNLIKAQYIEMDQRYDFYDGLLNNLTWSDDYRTLLDFKFLEIKDGNLIPVQVDMQTSQIDITFQDIHYQGTLYWFIWNGKLYHFQGSPSPADMLPEDGWSVEAIPGRTDVLLLKLTWGRPDYTEYQMLYYPDTGETEDFLAGTGADQLEYAYNWSWSENMRRVLILCNAGADGPQEWLCDLDTKTLTRLEELTGMDDLAEPDTKVSAIFADNDTLILTIPTTAEGDGTWQTVTCYAYDIPSGQKTKTLDETHYYRWDAAYGAQLFGDYCILIDRGDQVQLADLKTGMQTAIKGLTYQAGNNFMRSNPSCNKLMYDTFDYEGRGLTIPQLGVVNLEKGTFIAFDREVYENLHGESFGWIGLGWIDDSTVGINARTLDSETLYLILYTF